MRAQSFTFMRSAPGRLCALQRLRLIYDATLPRLAAAFLCTRLPSRR